MTTDTTEKGLETLIEASLLSEAGYEKGAPSDYDRAFCVDRPKLFAFLADPAREGQYHDYKSGLLVGTTKDDRKKFADELRMQIYGFASADGGVLLIGVHDETKIVDGCPLNIGETPIAEWARS